MTKQSDLSVEQEFSVRAFEQQVKDMNRQQATEMLVSMYRQMLLRQNSYQNLIKHQWGM